jgi:hypothetical protein
MPVVWWRSAGVVCGVILAAGLLAGTAAAQSTVVSVDQSEVTQGETVTVTGSGFQCDGTDDVGNDGPVDVYWDGDSSWDGKPFATSPATPYADNNGNVTFTVAVPENASPGVRYFTVSCEQTYAGGTFTVLAAQVTTSPTTTTTPTTATGSTTTATGTTTPTTATTTPVPGAANYRAQLPRTFASPSELGLTWLSLLVLLAVAGLFVLLIYLPLIGFPDEVFNRAFEERHERAFATQVAPSWVQVGLFAVLAGIMLCLVDPTAAVDWKTVALGIGLTVAVLVTTLSYEVPGQRLRLSITRQRAVLRTLPLALLIAMICAAVSRIADFQPGYVYGLIAGYPAIAIAAGVPERDARQRDDAKAVVVGVVVTLTVSLIAWLLWNRVDAAAEHADAGFGILVVDAALAATTLMGVQTVLFRLIPLRYLDGLILVRWSRAVWAAIYLPVTVAYLAILIQESEPVTPASVAKAMALFVAFGVFSLGYWAYVARKGRSPAPRA